MTTFPVMLWTLPEPDGDLTEADAIQLLTGLQEVEFDESDDGTIEQGVCAFFGESIETRIVRRREQRGAFPVITYRVEDDEATTLLTGDTLGRYARFEFKVYSPTYSDLRDIQEQIHNVLNGYNGAAGDRYIDTALFDGAEDDEEERDDGSEGCLYVRALYYDVHYR